MSNMNSLYRSHNLCGVIMLAWKYSSFGFATSHDDLNCTIKGVENKVVKNTNTFLTNSQFTGVMKGTLLDLQKEWCQRFSENKIPEPENSIKYIIQHVLKIRKPYEYEIRLRDKITENVEEEIRKLCECRLARMPVQYIIREWDFRDLKLEMCPPVFIPRPETEQLVDLVLSKSQHDAVILEVGCGSGAICLSLLKSLSKARVVAVDQSKMACELTKRNAQLNKLTSNLKVVHSKLQEDGSLTEPLELDTPVDILVSNPPYVPYPQLLDLEPEIKLYEDMRALEAGRDGLRVVKSLFLLSQTVVKPRGSIFLEVDSTHPPKIEQWVQSHPELKIEFVKSYKDYCDRDRFVELMKL